MNDFERGIALFQEGHWFEAHESLELAWKKTPLGDQRRFLQGLIQLAVSLEHARRGNQEGARRLWQKGTSKMEGLPAVYEGVALQKLLSDFENYFAEESGGNKAPPKLTLVLNPKKDSASPEED